MVPSVVRESLTDQGMIVIEKAVCQSQFPREVGALPHARPHWEDQGWSGGRRSKGNTQGHEPLLLFMWEGMVKAGQSGVGLTSMNDCSRLWGIGTVFTWTGPEMIKAVG